MKFTKMHGAGNDYVYVNCFEETIEDPSALAITVSDRHFGIGADGLVLILPSEIADFRMDMYNADGSRGKMCGNASRCVAKYVYDNHMTDKQEISLETLSGIKYIKILVADGKVVSAKVNMGEPILEPEKIPVTFSGKNIINEKITVGNSEYHMTCVSMGNPHCIIYVEDTETIEIEKIGPLFEHHPLFPERINTEFIQRIDQNTIKMRVWERGSGETLACGTGACAAAVACILNGYCKRGEDITVKLRGGELVINWTHEGYVAMTGPATAVFTGEFNL